MSLSSKGAFLISFAVNVASLMDPSRTRFRSPGEGLRIDLGLGLEVAGAMRWGEMESSQET